MRKFEEEAVKALINRQSPETKIYFGCDSYRFKKENKWYARFTTVVVIHVDGNHGCAVFGLIDEAADYDQKKNQPIMRMMNEVYRVADMYNLISDAIGDRHVEIHLDINPNKMHGSNVAYKPAVAYIKGVCGMDAIVKPEAKAASFCADHFRNYSEIKKAA